MEGDLPNNFSTIIKLLCLAFVGAFSSSCFCLAGGLLFTPLLPVIGMVPSVGSATA